MSSDKLIINADDFGLTRAVSDAVIEVHRNGSATSASLMATMPGAAYAAGLAKENPALGVGLHFTLTEGFSAVGGKNRLTASPDGRFFARNALMLRVAARLITAADLRQELEAQYARLKSLGVAPTHIDSHQHVHAFPPIFKVVTAFAASQGVPVRMPYTQAICRPEAALGAAYLYRETKHRLLSRLLRRCEALKKSPSNATFNSIFDVYPRRTPCVEDYRSLIEQRKGSPHELMIHPYILSDELKEVYSAPGWYRRKSRFFALGEAEHRVLSAFSIRDWLAENGTPLRLIHYGELAA